MSYSNPNVELTYDGNGSDQSFGVNFHYLEGTSFVIQVELWDFTIPDVPTQAAFVLDVDYTIDESGYPSTLVNTAVPVAVNFKLVIYRKTFPIQLSTFVNGAFPAESVEEGLDKVMMVSQEQDAKLGRAILNVIGGTEVTTADILEAFADIIVNAADIDTNEADIAANAAAIGVITPDTVVKSVIVDYTALVGEIIIVQAAGVTVTLPTPISAGKVTIKMDGIQASTIISSAAGIDGFGTTYTVSSEGESISLVSDGTKWFII